MRRAFSLLTGFVLILLLGSNLKSQQPPQLPIEITRITNHGEQSPINEDPQIRRFFNENPRINSDGRYVAFESTATNFGEDANDQWDVFVFDRQSGGTTLMSKKVVNGEVIVGNEWSNGFDPNISPDGRFVTFLSAEEEFIDPPPSSSPNTSALVFLHDRDTNLNGIFDEISLPLGVRTARICVGRNSRKVFVEPNSEHQYVVPSFYGGGNWLVLQSKASNLVEGIDREGWLSDIFLYNVSNLAMIPISLNPLGRITGNDESEIVGSRNAADAGTNVVFSSKASNLVDEDRGSIKDIFIRVKAVNRRVTRRIVSGNKNSEAATITPSGRFIVFRSKATNLITGERDTNNEWDIFVQDRDTDRDRIYDESGAVANIRVSKSHDGSLANRRSWDSDISNDGRFVVYGSMASNLVPNDSGGFSDIFLRDLQSGEQRRVSVASDGTAGNGDSTNPSISEDGKFIVFQSEASNLVAGDTNNGTDVFITGNTLHPDIVQAQASDLPGGPTVNSGSISVIVMSNSSVQISWRTNEPARCRAEYSLDESFATRTDMETELGTFHAAFLSGLERGARYNYRICCEDRSRNSACTGGQNFTIP